MCLHPGNTVLYVQIESEDQRFQYPEQLPGKAKVEVRVGQDFGELTFVAQLMTVLSRQTAIALEHRDSLLLHGVFNIIEFFAMCFPFFVEEICALVLGTFDAIKAEPLRSFAVEDGHIFTALTTIIARLIMCCPRSVTTEKLGIYSRLIDFLRDPQMVAGTFQETLSQGVFIAEFLQGIADKRSDDFLTLFANLNLTEGVKDNEQLKCLMSVNVLEIILKSFRPYMAQEDDAMWEGVAFLIDKQEDMDELKAFWTNHQQSQFEMIIKEKTVLNEAVFRRIVRSTCTKLVDRGLLPSDHPIFRLV